MAPPTEDQFRAFAVRGCAVVPNVVPRHRLNAATREIDDLIGREPSPADRRGFHFCWRNRPAPADPLPAPLADGPALTVVEAMIRPLKTQPPRQVRVSLNIPPYPHRPGGPHLDGPTPPAPDGRAGTFTLLAGVLLTDQTAEDMGNLWVWPGTHRVFAAHPREHGRRRCRARCARRWTT